MIEESLRLGASVAILIVLLRYRVWLYRFVSSLFLGRSHG